MVQPRVLVVVLAGGEGGRLELLTRSRAKPAVPYAGRYRLVDVVLSNVLHSGLSDVWLVEQTHPVSACRSTWATAGPGTWTGPAAGCSTCTRARTDDDRQGWHRGTADALWRHTALVREFAPDALVVLSADAVYRLDYEALVREHLGSGASVTMVTTRVDPRGRVAVRRGAGRGRPGRRLRLQARRAGERPRHERGLRLLARPVLDLLDELGDASGEDGPGDLGDELLPRLVEQGGAREHRLDGYWRDLGTVEAYRAAALDLVAADPPFDPGDEDWPLRTRSTDRRPARVRAGAVVEDALLCDGADVAGTVRRSVLGPGVVVEAGAEVVDSVLLDGRRRARRRDGPQGRRRPRRGRARRRRRGRRRRAGRGRRARRAAGARGRTAARRGRLERQVLEHLGDQRGDRRALASGSA